MQPILLEFGDFKLHWYGFFVALGFMFCFANWVWMGRKRGWDLQLCSDILFWVMVGGIIGARINYVISDFDNYRQDPMSMFRMWEGGLIFYGGFVGASVAVFTLARMRKIPLLAMTDFVITPIPLGHALGRVGCFMNGCCFGRPHEGALSCQFPRLSPPWYQQFYDGLITNHHTLSLPVYPVQLFETAANIGIYGLLLVLFFRTRHIGIVSGVYLLAYPSSRLLLENFRGTERIMIGPLSTAQTLSIALMSVGAIILAYSFHAKRTFDGPLKSLKDKAACETAQP